MSRILHVIYFASGAALVAGIALFASLFVTFWAFEKLVPY